MQEEPELIGLPAMTGGAVGCEVGLVFFDHVLHPAPRAVELLVEVFCPAPGDVSDDEAGIACALHP